MARHDPRASAVARLGPLGLPGLLVALAALAGCGTPPVTWDDVAYPAQAPVTPPAPAVSTIPAGACPGSFRATALGPVLYGAWWRVRPDSSAVLMAARSDDGGRSWPSPVTADTTDHSVRGCARPAPALVAGANGYVSFVYFLEPAEGAGIFFTHSMDGAHLGTGSGVFHAPVAVMYGTRPADVAIGADGDHVAVAFEDPNAERPTVDLALSRVMGHLFEARVPVSSPDLPAVAPHVRLRGDSVTVWWMERPDSVSTGGRVAVRHGRWRA